jgi:hypothetical protein
MSDTKKSEMSVETQEAVASVKMADLRKKINAGSWNDNMENLMKSWGEKAAGLRFMHDNASGSWKKFSNTLTLWSIGMTTVASGVSLIAASLDDEEAKNIVLYVTGGIGILSSLIQSLKKFYNSEEKSADHNAVARQFGAFYRYMTLQMNLTREDRLPSDQLSEYGLKEYERLQQEAPPLGGTQVALFRKTFVNSKQAIPDVCEKQFNINVYKPPSLIPTKKNIKEVEVEITKQSSAPLEDSQVEIDIDSTSNSSDVPPLV